MKLNFGWTDELIERYIYVYMSEVREAGASNTSGCKSVFCGFVCCGLRHSSYGWFGSVDDHFSHCHYNQYHHRRSI